MNSTNGVEGKLEKGNIRLTYPERDGNHNSLNLKTELEGAKLEVKQDGKWKEIAAGTPQFYDFLAALSDARRSSDGEIEELDLEAAERNANILSRAMGLSFEQVFSLCARSTRFQEMTVADLSRYQAGIVEWFEKGKTVDFQSLKSKLQERTTSQEIKQEFAKAAEIYFSRKEQIKAIEVAQFMTRCAMASFTNSWDAFFSDLNEETRNKLKEALASVPKYNPKEITTDTLREWNRTGVVLDKAEEGVRMGGSIRHRNKFTEKMGKVRNGEPGYMRVYEQLSDDMKRNPDIIRDIFRNLSDKTNKISITENLSPEAKSEFLKQLFEEAFAAGKMDDALEFAKKTKNDEMYQKLFQYYKEKEQFDKMFEIVKETSKSGYGRELLKVCFDKDIQTGLDYWKKIKTIDGFEAVLKEQVIKHVSEGMTSLINVDEDRARPTWNSISNQFHSLKQTIEVAFREKGKRAHDVGMSGGSRGGGSGSRISSSVSSKKDAQGKSIAGSQSGRGAKTNSNASARAASIINQAVIANTSKEQNDNLVNQKIESVTDLEVRYEMIKLYYKENGHASLLEGLIQKLLQTPGEESVKVLRQIAQDIKNKSYSWINETTAAAIKNSIIAPNGGGLVDNLKVRGNYLLSAEYCMVAYDLGDPQGIEIAAQSNFTNGFKEKISSADTREPQADFLARRREVAGRLVDYLGKYKKKLEEDGAESAKTTNIETVIITYTKLSKKSEIEWAMAKTEIEAVIKGDGTPEGKKLKLEDIFNKLAGYIIKNGDEQKEIDAIRKSLEALYEGVDFSYEIINGRNIIINEIKIGTPKITAVQEDTKASKEKKDLIVPQPPVIEQNKNTSILAQVDVALKAGDVQKELNAIISTSENKAALLKDKDLPDSLWGRINSKISPEGFQLLEVPNVFGGDSTISVTKKVKTTA